MRKFLGQMSIKQRGKLKLLKLSRTIMKLLKNIKGGTVLSFSLSLFNFYFILKAAERGAAAFVAAAGAAMGSLCRL